MNLTKKGGVPLHAQGEGGAGAGASGEPPQLPNGRHFLMGVCFCTPKGREVRGQGLRGSPRSRPTGDIF